jgi:hypothetical protein
MKILIFLSIFFLSLQFANGQNSAPPAPAPPAPHEIEFPPEILESHMLNDIVTDEPFGFATRMPNPPGNVPGTRMDIELFGKWGEVMTKFFEAPAPKTIAPKAAVPEAAPETSGLDGVEAGLILEMGELIYKIGTGKDDGGFIQKGACEVHIGGKHLACPESTKDIKGVRDFLNKVNAAYIESTKENRAYVNLTLTACATQQSRQLAVAALKKIQLQTFGLPGLVSGRPGYCNQCKPLGPCDTTKCGIILGFSQGYESSFEEFGLPDRKPSEKDMKFKVNVQTAKGQNVKVPVCHSTITPKELEHAQNVQENLGSPSTMAK